MGAGNMGAWLANKLADKNKIAVYSTNAKKTEVLKNIRNIKIISKLSEFEQFRPTLLINAVSLQNTISAFESVLKHLSPNCAIADIASIKTGLPKFYKKCGHKFASVHPMFGPTFANIDTLKNESFVVIKESDSKTAEFFIKFFSGLGLKKFEYTFKEHDEMMAYSLTLPFVSTMIFAACINSKAVPGTTFKKHMIIAKGLLSENDFLLTEILFNPFSMKQLEKVTSRLEFLKHIIKGKDYEEAKKFFELLRKNII